MPSIQQPDGRWTHTFSASWLSSFATCPEQARQRYFNLTPYTSNDYTALGNGLHAAIERSLRVKMGEVDGVGFDDGALYGLDKLMEIEAEPGFTYKKWDKDSIRAQFLQHLKTFHDEIYPITKPIAVEQEFDLQLFEDTFREVRLRGFIDYIDAELGVIDWKTSGAPYKPWEKERYEKQPTAYAWAWEQLSGQPVDAMRYVVFVHGKSPQTFEVKRNDGHIEWLRRQALAAARLIEANLSVWPMVDTGWHCSPKWCSAWDTCRGQFLGREPW